jgi:aminoglycoside phosphotransferase (APT) family kinase protein
VLRRPPPGDQVPGGNDMTREFVVMAKVVMMRRRHMVVFACGVRRMCMSL